MEQTVTAKFSIIADDIAPLIEVAERYRDACNYVSEKIFELGSDEKLIEYSRIKVQKLFYRDVRDKFDMKSQMAISVTWTVSARYKTFCSQIRDSVNEHKRWEKRKADAEESGRPFREREPRIISWKAIEFRVPQCDQVAVRDWSMQSDGRISLNTLEKRFKAPYSDKGYEKYRGMHFGTGKLVIRKGRAYLYTSASIEVPDVSIERIAEDARVKAVDLGQRFNAVSYDGSDTEFHRGGELKNRRVHESELRRGIQKCNTKSAKRRIRRRSQRENRYVENEMHVLSKTLLADMKCGEVLVLEDLTGIRMTSTVKKGDRYYRYSWPYNSLRQKIEYKAKLKGVAVLFVPPQYTSITCPRCRNVAKYSRNRTVHEYLCTCCGYCGNDDRTAAINIRQRGLELLEKQRVS